MSYSAQQAPLEVQWSSLQMYSYDSETSNLFGAGFWMCFPGYCFSYCKLLCKFNHRARRIHFVHIQTSIVSRTCILLLFSKTLMTNLEYPYGLLILYILSQWILLRFQNIVVLLVLRMKTQNKRIFRSFSVVYFSTHYSSWTSSKFRWEYFRSFLKSKILFSHYS